MKRYTEYECIIYTDNKPVHVTLPSLIKAWRYARSRTKRGDYFEIIRIVQTTTGLIKNKH